MLNRNKTSIDAVIEGVIRDYGFSDISYGDVAEWVREAIDLIGLPGVFDKIFVELEIEDNKAQLPCNLIEELTIRDKDTENKYALNNTEFALQDTPDSYYLYYVINDGVITTSTTGNTLEMEYRGYALSDGGWPLIPDDSEYKAFLRDFIAEKMAFKAWIQGEFPEAAYRDIQRRKQRSAGAATVKQHMMTIPESEAFVNLMRNIGRGNSVFSKKMYYKTNRL